MWRRYRDLYAGGEQLREHASQYLARRNKEPDEIYVERLNRVFYENYIGSIVDWYAATLMRRAPVVTFDGMGAAAKRFYAALSERLRLQGHDPDRVLPAGTGGDPGLRQQLHRGGFPAEQRTGGDARGRGCFRTIAGISGELWTGRSHQLELRRCGADGMGGDPDVLPAAIESYRCDVGAGDALDLLRPRELSNLPPGAENRNRSN